LEPPTQKDTQGFDNDEENEKDNTETKSRKFISRQAEMIAIDQILPKLSLEKKTQILIISGLFRVMYASLDFAISYETRRHSIFQVGIHQINLILFSWKNCL